MRVMSVQYISGNPVKSVSISSIFSRWIPIRWHQSRGYQTMGRLAMGISALERSRGLEVKVLSDSPGPHRIKAWRPGDGTVACGMLIPIFVCLL